MRISDWSSDVCSSDLNGTVTAGNASGLNDGAAAVLMMTATEAKARGVAPMARLVAYAHAGVDPKYMGIGPIPATRAALRSEEHTYELQSLMRTSYAVFCLKKKNKKHDRAQSIT